MHETEKYFSLTEKEVKDILLFLNTPMGPNLVSLNSFITAAITDGSMLIITIRRDGLLL